MYVRLVVAMAVSLAAAAAALAAAEDETAFGRPGNAGKASRTVTVTMSDAMRFLPAELTVKEGETVKFVVMNAGKTMHELVLGSAAELKAHAELMREYPTMKHDEPWMVHVPPGRRRTLTWQFTRAGEYHYGCLIPGHFEAGMVGRVTVFRQSKEQR